MFSIGYSTRLRATFHIHKSLLYDECESYKTWKTAKIVIQQGTFWKLPKVPCWIISFCWYLKNYDSNQKSCFLSVIVLGCGELLVFLSLFYDECESYKTWKTAKIVIQQGTFHLFRSYLLIEALNRKSSIITLNQCTWDYSLSQ